MATLLRLLDQHADRDPAHVACVVGDERRAYGELADQVLRFASGLVALGLRPGDRVSLYLPNSVDYVIAFYGVMRAGMVANPVNSVFTPSEVSYFISDCAAAALVTTPELLARLAAAPGELPVKVVITTGPGRPDAGRRWASALLADVLGAAARALPYPDDSTPACLPYSSGTTGRSKGIIHTHDSLAMQAILSANHLQLRRDDVRGRADHLRDAVPGAGGRGQRDRHERLAGGVQRGGTAAVADRVGVPAPVRRARAQLLRDHRGGRRPDRGAALRGNPAAVVRGAVSADRGADRRRERPRRRPRRGGTAHRPRPADHGRVLGRPDDTSTALRGG